MATTEWTNRPAAIGQAPATVGRGRARLLSTDVTIGVAGGYTVTLAGESGAANSLTINDTPATLDLSAAASLAVQAGFTNSGTLDIDVFGGDGGSTLTIGGTLINTGVVSIGEGSLSGLTTVSAAGLVNSGSLTLQGNTTSGTTEQATLDITGSGTDTGAIALGGDAVLSAGSLAVQGGGALSVGSGGTATGGLTVANGGFELVSNGGTSTSPTIAGGKLELASGAVASGPIAFTGSGGTLKIDGTVMPANAISGFVAGDTLDLAGIGVAASYSYSGGILKLDNSGGTQVAQPNLLTPVTNPHFTLGTDGGGGTVVGLSPTNTGTIYSGTYLSGIVLSNPATQDPTTLAAGGYATNQTAAHNGDAVYGTNAAAWNFTNFGMINATGAAAAGVFLSAGGTVTNGAAAGAAGAFPFDRRYRHQRRRRPGRRGDNGGRVRRRDQRQRRDHRQFRDDRVDGNGNDRRGDPARRRRAGHQLWFDYRGAGADRRRPRRRGHHDRNRFHHPELWDNCEFCHQRQRRDKPDPRRADRQWSARRNRRADHGVGLRHLRGRASPVRRRYLFLSERRADHRGQLRDHHRRHRLRGRHRCRRHDRQFRHDRQHGRQRGLFPAGRGSDEPGRRTDYGQPHRHFFREYGGHC